MTVLENRAQTLVPLGRLIYTGLIEVKEANKDKECVIWSTAPVSMIQWCDWKEKRLHADVEGIWCKEEAVLVT